MSFVAAANQIGPKINVLWSQEMFDPRSLPRLIFPMLIALLCEQRLSADEPIRIRVLSYNIHHAAGMDRKIDLPRIARVIRDSKADVIALQEVDQNATRSMSVDQSAKLAKLCEMRFVFGGNIPLQGGRYGNAILSRFPITQHQNHKLPNMNDGEQRGLLIAELAVSPKETVTLFATHLDHRSDDSERVASARFINQQAQSYGERSILLAGDLNAVIGSPTLGLFDASWKRANDSPMPTVPVGDPKRQIDFVLFRPASRWKTIDVTVLQESIASDHRGILAILELNAH